MFVFEIPSHEEILEFQNFSYKGLESEASLPPYFPLVGSIGCWLKSLAPEVPAAIKACIQVPGSNAFYIWPGN